MSRLLLQPFEAVASGGVGVRRNLAWWALPRVLGRLSSVLLLPVYTRVLAPAELGTALAALAISGAMALVVAPGAEAVYLRYAYRPGDERERWSGVGTVLAAHYALTTVAIGVLFALGPAIAGAVMPGIPAWPFYYLVLGAVAADAVSAPYQAAWRARRRADVIAIIQALQALVVIGATLIALLGLRWGAVSIVVGILAGSVVPLPFVAVTVLPKLAEPWNAAALRVVAPVMLAGFPVSVSTWVLTGFDRLLLNRERGVAELGIFGVAYQIGAVLTFAVITLNKEWGPLVAGLAVDGQGRATVQSLAVRTLRLGVIFGSLMAVLSGPIVQVIGGGQYAASASLVPIVVLIGLIQIPYLFFYNVATAQGRGGAMATASVLGVVVNVAANLLLIPRFGGMGAAWAGVLGYAAVALALGSRPWNFIAIPSREAAWLLLLLATTVLGLRAPAPALALAGLAMGALLVAEGYRYWRFLGRIRAT
ncbi:MAG: polysaccharide biosynthesis C-terminal domain-containing protein [Candidatus Rokubacteria bacterium]|nr:polysaccharide biosynthesis C-terminal domain-containing protein [Candidatus Rokubacteria bacterium]